MKIIFLTTIKIYQKYISTSRFFPLCSQFTYEMVLKYGTIKGLYLGFRRVLRCHPFSNGGLDLVK